MTSGVLKLRHAAVASQLLIRERRHASSACAARASRVVGACDRHTASSRVGPVALATRAPVPAHFPPFVRREWREVHAQTQRERALLASHERAGENARNRAAHASRNTATDGQGH